MQAHELIHDYTNLDKTDNWAIINVISKTGESMAAAAKSVEFIDSMIDRLTTIKKEMLERM